MTGQHVSWDRHELANFGIADDSPRTTPFTDHYAAQLSIRRRMLHNT